MKLIIILIISFFLNGCLNKNLIQNNKVTRINGIDYLKNNEYKSASLEFNKILSYDVKNPNLQFLNAFAYHLLAEQGDFSQYQYAEIGYKLALKFDNNNWLAYKQLALLYLKTRKYNLAQEYSIQALFYKPNDATMLYVLAYSSYFLNNLKIALYSLKEAYKIDQKNSIILRSLIMSYSSMGNFKKAKNFLNKYIKINKNKNDIDYLKHRISDWQHFYSFNFNKIESKNISSKKEINKDDDIEHKMVNINVVIIGVHQQINNNIGINLFDGLSFQFGKSLNTESISLTDKLIPENSTNTYSKTITTALSIPDIQYSLNIFNHNVENYSIIAKPTLVALNEHQSEYFSGDSMHIGLISTTEASNSEIVELPIGVKLIITPKFLSKNRIQLEVEAERTTMDETGTGGTFKSVVWTSKKYIHVNAALEFDDTLIIGGLNEKERESSTSKTPLFGNLPLIKYLFSKEDTMDWSRSDLILLTPKKIITKSNKNNNKQFLLKELKKIYPYWVIKNKAINNNYVKKQLRNHDFLYLKWNDKKNIENILQKSYFIY